jgi:glucose/arabinose dehydrogenase
MTAFGGGAIRNPVTWSHLRSVAPALALLVVLPVNLAEASAGGRSGFSGDPASNAGTVCTVCHTPGSAPTPVVTLGGPSVIDAGTTAQFFVTLQGGPAATAGVGIAAGSDIGHLQPAGCGLQPLDGELTHIAPKAFSDGLATFLFNYTAPNYDTQVTLYAAGNSTNGALDLLGDGVASSSYSLTVRNGFEDPPPPPEPAQGELEATLVVSGFNQPVAIANAGDARMFVVERLGLIRIVNSSNVIRATPFLNLTTIVDASGGEQGLLGMAFHPDYATNGYFYVHYTRDPGPSLDRSRVSRFRVGAGTPNIADAGSELVLMEFEQPFANHNGGDLQFGPDGYLYIASGDGGSGGDPQDNGQKTTTLLGKILRIDVDTPPGAGSGPDCSISAGANYSIPAANAFNDGDGGSGCDEIFALGLRNPWRIGFDRLTGALWIGDVGQNLYEEINYLPPGSAGGINLGWRCYEGDSPYNLTNCNLDYLPPVHTYSHATGACSVTGGRVYRGSLFPVLDGQYFFSDFCRASVRALSGPPGGILAEREVLPTGTLAAPSAFGEGATGELYVTDLGTGSLYRLGAVLAAGDVQGDGDVDLDDVIVIGSSLGQKSSGDADRRDLDGNGVIEATDGHMASASCTRPGCAVE